MNRWTLLPLLAGVCVPLAAQTTISNVSVNNASPALREKVEVRFDLSQSYANPFDPAEADVRLIVTEPDAVVLELPAFYYTAYDSSNPSNEILSNPHDAGWRARFAPRKTGAHQLSIEVVDANGTGSLAGAASFTCMGASTRGFLKRDPRDSRFLAYEDGTPYQPVGHNQSWAGNPGTYDYVNRFGEMGVASENWSRVWMTHFFKGQSLEWTGGTYPGLGEYSLPNAWRIDRIIGEAEEQGIAVQLVLHHHGQFSTTVNSNWNENPYNSANGGMLGAPGQYFTNAQARSLAKQRLRYTVARWGYSSSILAWELFNEVQFTDGFRTSAAQRANVAAWHQEMADYLKLIDVHEHLVTTSSSEEGLFDAIWSIPSIDLIQVHDYGPSQMSRFRDIHASLSSFNKPIYFGEYGSDDGGAGAPPEQNPGLQGEPANTQILEGLPLHNGMWCGAMLGGGAMHWYWDYIEAQDFYELHLPLAQFLAGEDMAAQNPAAAQVLFDGTVARDVQFSGGVTDFFAASSETEFVITQAGNVPMINKLSQYLHGNFQPALKSDPKFTGAFQSGGQFTVMVDEVSAAGSNSIQIRIDNVPVLSQPMTNGSLNVAVSVPVSAGQHTIQVVNTGQDWMDIDYFRAENIDGSLVDAIGLVGPTKGWIWFLDTGSQYREVDNGLLQGQVAHVQVPADGEWQVEFHATRAPGGVVETLNAVATGGELVFTIPDFQKDIAAKLSAVSSRVEGWTILGTF